MEEETTAANLFVWGNDTCGQLGLGNTRERLCNVPVPCNVHLAIAQVACGAEHSALRSVEGLVYVMGSNIDGRLGLDNREIKRITTPTLVKGIEEERITTIACGAAHTAAVTSAGQVYAWGLGSSGALGTGDGMSRWGPTLVTVPDHQSVRNVACGGRHSAFIAQDEGNRNSLYLCGAGDSGQLGHGNRDSLLQPTLLQCEESVEEAACGSLHTLFRTASGQIYAMGSNSFGQLGIGSKRSCFQPVLITALDGLHVKQLACWSNSAAVTMDGQVYIWGSGIFGEFLIPQCVTGINEAVYISIGGGFAAVIDKAGEVWTWGTNTGGELGLGDNESRSAPVQVPALQGRAFKQVACGATHFLALPEEFSAQKTQRLSQIRIDSSSIRSLPEPESGSQNRLLRLYQGELEARKTLEMELFREQQVKLTYMKQVETLTLESQDLRDTLRRLEMELARAQTDLAWHSQSSLQLAAKNKVLTERCREIPQLQQKVEDLQIAIAVTEKEKQKLEKMLNTVNAKQEKLEKTMIETTKELKNVKSESQFLQEELEIAHHSATEAKKKLEKSHLEAELSIQSLSRRQSELEAEWSSQLRDQNMKVQSQSEVISELRSQLQTATSSAQKWQVQAERLAAQVTSLTLEVRTNNTVIAELKAANERHEAKNHVLVEALEREVKGSAGSLRRATEVLGVPSFRQDSATWGQRDKQS